MSKNQPPDFVQISLACGTSIFEEIFERLRLPISVIATVAGESLTANYWFSKPLLDADIESLKSHALLKSI